MVGVLPVLGTPHGDGHWHVMRPLLPIRLACPHVE
jgi:hypothetical protein